MSARKQQSRFREAQLLPTGLLREEVGTLMLSREVLRRQTLIHVEDTNRLSFMLKLSSSSRSTARTLLREEARILLREEVEM